MSLILNTLLQKNHYFLYLRWLKTFFNIKVDAIGKQRKVADTWSGDDIVVEEAPFKFPIKEKKGCYTIKSAPWGYVSSLTNHITDVLDSLL